MCEDKTPCVERSSPMSSPNHNCVPPNCKSATLQADSPLTYVKQSEIQEKPFCDVWIHSVPDVLMEINFSLLAMKEFLSSLQQNCGDTSVT